MSKHHTTKYQWEGRLESYISEYGEDIRKDSRCTPSNPKIRISYDEESDKLIIEKRIPSDEDELKYELFDSKELIQESIIKELIKGFKVGRVKRSSKVSDEL